MDFEQTQKMATDALAEMGVEVSSNIAGILSDIQKDFHQLVDAIGDSTIAVSAVQTILVSAAPEAFNPLPDFDDDDDDEVTEH
jgi:hypothetical protein